MFKGPPKLSTLCLICIRKNKVKFSLEEVPEDLKGIVVKDWHWLALIGQYLRKLLLDFDKMEIYKDFVNALHPAIRLRILPTHEKRITFTPRIFTEILENLGKIHYYKMIEFITKVIHYDRTDILEDLLEDHGLWVSMRKIALYNPEKKGSQLIFERTVSAYRSPRMIHEEFLKV